VVIYAAANVLCDQMPLDRISQCDKAILSTTNPELQKSFLEKGVLANERKMEPDAL
jgi:F-type H+-transporting ATPase subunit alpha